MASKDSHTVLQREMVGYILYIRLKKTEAYLEIATAAKLYCAVIDK